ncbi:MAG: hypothetical protein HRT35_37345, partial [Algicola sp.]|nr:hypothetical protein [Algicola sp.]
MKKNTLLGRVLLCIALMSTAVTAETWIPISNDGLTFFIPKINFHAEQLSASDYRLSWHEQSNTDTYKVERLVADLNASNNSTEIATKWDLINEQTGNSLDVTHNLTSLGLGVNQSYRLSTCSGANCTAIETVSFQVDVDNLTNTIPQNVQVSTQTFSLQSGKTGLTTKGRINFNENSNNPYAYGKGYHFETGHSSSGHSSPGPKFGPRHLANLTETQDPEKDVEITWEPVVGASHYMLSKATDRGEAPTFELLYDSDHSRYFHASSQSFKFGGLSNGTHIFIVYACNENGFCGGASVAAQREIISIPPAAKQVASLYVPEFVEDNSSYTIQWTPPTDTVDITGYQLKGELSGTFLNFGV